MARTKTHSAVALDALQKAFDAEMTGVALYTHLALRVFGPQRIGIVAHLRASAAESLTHAEAVGDLITSMGGVPEIPPGEHLAHSPRTLAEILDISLVHERQAVDLYRAALDAAGGDVALEEFARKMIVTEMDDAADLEKMLRPMG